MQATQLSGQCSGHQATGLQVIKRDGRLVPFDATKIAVALGKAFLAVEANRDTLARADFRAMVGGIIDLLDRIDGLVAAQRDARENLN